MTTVDLLAIAAHRDDVELTCAGTLIKMARAGYRTGIVDLTGGETGTRGDAATRGKEAEAAAKVMGVAQRVNAGLPDAHLHNTDETRRVVIELIRQLQPRVVILPFPVGRLGAGPRRVLPARPGEVRRRGPAAPPREASLRAGLSRRPSQTHVRG